MAQSLINSRKMITLEEAQALVMAEVAACGKSEEVELLAALGRVLAEDVEASFDVPPADCSAMDGFAVLADDLMGACADMPVTLRLIGEVAAGQSTKAKLWTGEAVQVMTGAPLPEGTQAVVPVEDTRQESDRVSILRQLPKGINIRVQGEDVRQGDTVLRQGAWLGPARIGLLASIGRDRVKVSCRPQVAVLSTGNELLEPGQPQATGKIYSSNHYALAAQVRRAGAEPVLLGIAPDSRQGLKEFLARGLEHPVLVTSGGVSVGKYDLVKDVLEELGVEIKFWKVAIKPGKPTLFGARQGNLVFGLPGYPVAASLSFEHFVRPVIARMLGTDYVPSRFEAVLEEDLKCKPGRKQFLRACLCIKDGAHYVCPLKGQGSGRLSSLSLANSLIIIPPEVDCLVAGQKVTVQLLDS